MAKYLIENHTGHALDFGGQEPVEAGHNKIAELSAATAHRLENTHGVRVTRREPAPAPAPKPAAKKIKTALKT